MSQYEPETSLFRFTNKAKARNSDPPTSHIAADKMNEGDKLRKSQRFVLRWIKEFNGMDAQSIAVEVAHRLTGVPKWMIRLIMKITGMFQKRTPELASQGLVDREKKDDKLIVSINDKGLMALEKNK